MVSENDVLIIAINWLTLVINTTMININTPVLRLPRKKSDEKLCNSLVEKFLLSTIEIIVNIFLYYLTLFILERYLYNALEPTRS